MQVRYDGSFNVREVAANAISLGGLQRLRGDVYVASKFLKREELDDGKDVDDYDAVSRHVGVYLPDTKPVGTLRMILPSDLPLQVEARCGIEPVPNSVEASRFVVDYAFRKSVVGPGLMRWFIAACKSSGVEMCYALVEMHLYEYFRDFGLPFEQLGGMVETYNSWNIPIGVRIEDMIPGVRSADEKRVIKFAPFLEIPNFEGSMREGDLFQA